MKDDKKKSLGLLVAMGDAAKDEGEGEMTADRKTLAIKKLAKALGIDPGTVKTEAALDAVQTLITECSGEEDDGDSEDESEI